MAIRELNNEEIKFVSGGFHCPGSQDIMKAFNYTLKKTFALYCISKGFKSVFDKKEPSPNYWDALKGGSCLFISAFLREIIFS